MKHTPYPKNREVAKALNTTFLNARSSRFKHRLNTLIMYSGGLDSVAMLVNVLKETNHRVHVHHIKIINFEKRDDVEHDAVKNTLEYIRTLNRNFGYSTSCSEFC